jgi:uroporphyrinogen III methyltransferase/synthase
VDRVIRGLSGFHWMIFTSVNGVHFFFKRLFELGQDCRALAHLKIAAIGDVTAKALEERGISPDLKPGRFTTEALVKTLQARGQIRGNHFLLVRTDIAPDFLAREIEKHGGKATEITAYRTKPAPNRMRLARLLESTPVDYVAFTSASTVTHFFDAIPAKKRSRIRSRFVTIGPVTTQTLKEFGYKPYREARVHTIPGLVEVLVHGAK